MNVYFCHERGEEEGLYIVAQSGGRARSIYSGFSGVRFLKVKCRAILRGVEGEEDILQVGSPKLKEYGISYYNEKGEEME